MLYSGPLPRICAEPQHPGVEKAPPHNNPCHSLMRLSYHHFMNEETDLEVSHPRSYGW